MFLSFIRSSRIFHCIYMFCSTIMCIVFVANALCYINVLLILIFYNNFLICIRYLTFSVTEVAHLKKEETLQFSQHFLNFSLKLNLTVHFFFGNVFNNTWLSATNKPTVIALHFTSVVVRE